MQASEIYTLALSFVSELPQDQGADLQGFIIPWLNLLLQESLTIENSILRYEGLSELAAAPMLEKLSDEIPYHDEITRLALPYGLAWLLFQDDENDYRSQLYRNLYISALNEAMKLSEGDIEDVYANG